MSQTDMDTADVAFDIANDIELVVRRLDRLAERLTFRPAALDALNALPGLDVLDVAARGLREIVAAELVH